MKKFNENIVISPSGQLYGSENVLLDFLTTSSQTYLTYVPSNSIFEKKLAQHNLRFDGFRSIKMLYLKIIYKLMLNKSNVILNEAGHIKYLKIIARLFPNQKFVVIVRLLEDCNSRINNLPTNITLVAVSHFIGDHIESNARTYVIYDPYELKEIHKETTTEINEQLVNIGIVGRLTKSKGLDAVTSILNKLPNDTLRRIKLNFYGSYNSTDPWFEKFEDELILIEDLQYELKGFVGTQNEIYQNCNLILHLNKMEPLGRIIFEAVEYSKPFLCFKSGGTGELAKVLNLDVFRSENEEELAKKLYEFICRNLSYAEELECAKKIIRTQFNCEHYVSEIEALL